MSRLDSKLSPRAEDALNHLFAMVYAQPTLNKSDLHSLLMYTEGKVLTCGQMLEIRSKHLGVGVYRVWLDRKPPGERKGA